MGRAPRGAGDAARARSTAPVAITKCDRYVAAASCVGVRVCSKTLDHIRVEEACPDADGDRDSGRAPRSAARGAPCCGAAQAGVHAGGTRGDELLRRHDAAVDPSARALAPLSRGSHTHQFLAPPAPPCSPRRIVPRRGGCLGRRGGGCRRNAADGMITASGVCSTSTSRNNTPPQRASA
jgi:hypothetical protein